jgi:N6-adenosine-specific RNA methylase IME4
MAQLIISRSRVRWAERIAKAWQSSVDGIFETGKQLIAAKDDLDHGEFSAMIESDLPFGRRTAQMLMKVAADRRLTNAKHVSLLPPHWGTLYQLTKLPDDVFRAKIKDGTIHPDMQRNEVAKVAKRQAREQREAALGVKQYALPQKKYGAILADPEWRFQTWSPRGMDNSSPENHYPTSVLAEIKARDVSSISANDCALFLCATPPLLKAAMQVMEAWGFTYITNAVWVKDREGTGYWFRFRHEHLLLGTRGNVPCPAPGDQWDSVIEQPRGAHSEKPEAFCELIEAYFPSLPKIELNRRGPARAGWDAWGNEAEPAEAAE